MSIPTPVGHLGAQLGNLSLGWRDSANVGTYTQGVNGDQIGPLYDMALGYDPGTGTAVMVGYVVAEGKTWEQDTSLQNTQQLIQVASPSFTDRDLTFWPKVSQGDWSGGERQLIFEVANRFYMSDGGVDGSKPGRLQLMPGLDQTQAFSETHAGDFVSGPLATDGTNVYLGMFDPTGPTNLVIFSGGSSHKYAIGTGQIFDILNTPLGIFVANAGGIYQVNPNGAKHQWANDQLFPRPGKSMAYFDNKLWYITKSVHDMDRISWVDQPLGAAPGNPVFTNGVAPELFEATFDCIGSSATGLIVSTNVNGAWTTPPAGATAGSTMSVVYTSDGTTLTRIADINGRVCSIYEMNGVTYLLCLLFQPLIGHFDYVLFSVSDTSMTVVDDLRYGLPDFQVVSASAAAFVNGTLLFYGHLFGDGRFLYIGWPGLPGLRYDTVAGGVQSITPTVDPNVTSHRLIILDDVGITESSTAAVGSDTVTVLNFYPLTPPAKGALGQLTTSYIDFATPALTKFFRSFEIELAEALPPGASVAVEFRLDGVSGWEAVVPQVFTPTSLICYLPSGTKGRRISYRLTLKAGNHKSPVIASYSVKGNLGRTWKTEVTCKRNQLLRNGQEDQQGMKAKDLIANLERAYDNAGKVVLFVPSAKSDVGWERVDAVLEDYSLIRTQGAPDPGDQGTVDIEGNVSLTLIEA